MARPGFLCRFAVLEQYAHVDSAILGDWLRLTIVAARSMNGGRFIGSRSWDARTWARVTGLLSEDVGRVVGAGLAAWEGDDLVLDHYDHDGEALYQAQSAGGREGLRRRQEQRQQPRREEPPQEEAPAADPQDSREDSAQETCAGDLPGRPDQETCPGDLDGSTMPDLPRHSIALHSSTLAAREHDARARDAPSKTPRKTPAKDRPQYKLRALLERHLLPHGDKQLREWSRLASSQIGAKNHVEALAALDWLIRYARTGSTAADGTRAPVAVRWADDCLRFVDAAQRALDFWRRHPEQAPADPLWSMEVRA